MFCLFDLFQNFHAIATNETSPSWVYISEGKYIRQNSLGTMEQFKVVRLRFYVCSLLSLFCKRRVSELRKVNATILFPICMKLIIITMRFCNSFIFVINYLQKTSCITTKKSFKKPASKTFLNIQVTPQKTVHFNMRFNFKSLTH